MNLFGLEVSISRNKQNKSSVVGRNIALQGLGQPQWTPRNYASFAEEGYQKNVAVYGSIREIISGAKSLQWQLFKRQNGKISEIKDHPLLSLIKKPNPQQTGSTFIENAVGYYLLSGNEYEEVILNSRNLPIELYTHRPDRMRVVPGPFGPPAAFEYTVNGIVHKWMVDPITGKAELSQWKSFNPLNDWYGMSAIEAAAFSIDTHNQAGAWNKSLLDSGARPSGALVYESGSMTDTQKKDLRAELKDKYSGAKNAGSIFVLDGGLDWREMGLSPKDMEHIEGKNMSAREIALAYGIPPQILGIPGDNTYSNQKEARLAMWENTILPHADSFKGRWNTWLAPYFGDNLFLDYNKDAIPALSLRRETIWNRVKDADFLTDNEKREAVGYAPIKNGDTIYKPISSVPAGSSFGTIDGNKNFEAKFLNLQSPEDRAKEWQAQVSLRMKFERVMTPEIAKILDDRAKAAAEAFKSGGVQAVKISMEGHTPEMANLLKSNYTAVMEEFGARIMDAFKHKVSEHKDAESFFKASIIQWVNRYAAGRANLISGTTIDTIFETIKEGESEGLTNDEIANNIIEKTGGEIGFARARNIAQTEVHAAAVAASDIGIDSMGLTDRTKRIWLSSGDAATRSTHLQATGQLRDMKTPFDIGGAKLMRPGDPAGPPEEVIACRCVLIYEV